jgi:hypothetical protein
MFSFKTLFSVLGNIMLSFGRIWVSMGLARHTASYPVCTGALSFRIKLPGREADHSPPSSAEVKKAWNHTSTPQYVFMAWCLVKLKVDVLFK